MKIKIIAFLAFVLLSNVSLHAQNINIDILRKIHVNRNQNLDPSMNFLSNSVGPLSIITPIGLYGIGLIRKDSSLKRTGFLVGGTVLISGAISSIIKVSVKAERPYVTYPYIKNVGPKVGNNSFPSGHTTQAFALATSLSVAYPKWYVIVPASAYALGAGYSRMHLGAHYPRDVVVGAIIGSGSAYLSHRLNKWFYATNRKRIK